MLCVDTETIGDHLRQRGPSRGAVSRPPRRNTKPAHPDNPRIATNSAGGPRRIRGHAPEPHISPEQTSFKVRGHRVGHHMPGQRRTGFRYTVAIPTVRRPTIPAMGQHGPCPYDGRNSATQNAASGPRTSKTVTQTGNGPTELRHIYILRQGRWRNTAGCVAPSIGKRFEARVVNGTYGEKCFYSATGRKGSRRFRSCPYQEPPTGGRATNAKEASTNSPAGRGQQHQIPCRRSARQRPGTCPSNQACAKSRWESPGEKTHRPAMCPTTPAGQ